MARLAGLQQGADSRAGIRDRRKNKDDGKKYRKGSLQYLGGTQSASARHRGKVELGLLQHVVAASQHYSPNTISDLRNVCIDEIKETHGVLPFENAVKYQKS